MPKAVADRKPARPSAAAEAKSRPDGGDEAFEQVPRQPAPGCSCGGGCPRCAPTAIEALPRYPYHQTIARAFGIADFSARAAVDPSVRELGADAATEGEQVRFARPPSLAMAAHEAAHVMQRRGGGRPTDRAGAERHATEVSDRVLYGHSAADLMGPGLVSAACAGPLLFIPSGSSPTTVTVPGDTLEQISIRYFGEARYAEAIRRANPTTIMRTPAGVYTMAPGAVLTIPDRPDPADPWVNPEISPLLRTGGVWTQPQAEAALLAFAAETSAHRDAMVARYIGFGNLQALLEGLPANSTQAGGTYETQARDLLQRIQRVSARADAAAQGLPNEGAMARAQATEMISRNRAAAAAALPAGSPPPTTAQVAAQQANQAAQGSIQAQTGTMTPAQETTINTTLNNTSIPAFVTWATANQPSLGLTAAHLRADARAVFDRGIGVIAFADGTNLRAVVGEEFMNMVTANPAYALGTVVHEVWGHNTYEGRGNYGNRGAAYGLDIYDAAAARMPGYHRPAAGSAGRRTEIDKYGYLETEMYSLMREVPYYTPNAPAHSALTANYDPGPAVQARMQEIKDAYEPRVARALVRGLYQRFLADPTINAAAMAAFRNAVPLVFTVAADATAILA